MTTVINSTDPQVFKRVSDIEILQSLLDYHIAELKGETIVNDLDSFIEELEKDDC